MEKENEPIELNDEEVDEISGGRAFVTFDPSSGWKRNAHVCHHKNISSKEFVKNLYKKFTCDHYDRIPGNTAPKSCHSCKHYVDDYNDWVGLMSDGYEYGSEPD